MDLNELTEEDVLTILIEQDLVTLPNHMPIDLND